MCLMPLLLAFRANFSAATQVRTVHTKTSARDAVCPGHAGQVNGDEPRARGRGRRRAAVRDDRAGSAVMRALVGGEPARDDIALLMLRRHAQDEAPGQPGLFASGR